MRPKRFEGGGNENDAEQQLEYFGEVVPANMPRPLRQNFQPPSADRCATCIRTTPMVCAETGVAMPMTAASVTSPANNRLMPGLACLDQSLKR
jgi:hypothetical protein